MCAILVALLQNKIKLNYVKFVALYVSVSTHLQAFFVNADHHPRVLTLHIEANIQSALVLLGLSVFPGPVVEGGGQRQVGQAVRHRWREGKGQTGAS